MYCSAAYFSVSISLGDVFHINTFQIGLILSNG